MGFEMKITGSDGRSHKNLADMVQAETQRMVSDHVARVEQAVRAERCTVHNESPSVAVHREADGLRFAITRGARAGRRRPR
jgi:nitrous oxide reductase